VASLENRQGLCGVSDPFLLLSTRGSWFNSFADKDIQDPVVDNQRCELVDSERCELVDSERCEVFVLERDASLHVSEPGVYYFIVALSLVRLPLYFGVPGDGESVDWWTGCDFVLVVACTFSRSALHTFPKVC